MILALLGSAMLFYFAFPNVLTLQGFSLGGWLFAIPLLFFMERASLSRRIFYGFLWGLVSYAFLVHWLAPVSMGGYGLFVLVLSSQPVIFAVLLGWGPASKNGQLFYVPCAWVFSEVARAFLLGGFFWSVAYSQAFQPSVIQTAAWGGVSSVAWLLLFVNTALYLWIRSPLAGKGYLLAAATVFLLNALWGQVLLKSPKPVRETIRVSTVQPNIARQDKLDTVKYDQHLEKHLLLTRESFRHGRPEMVIWPETAFPDDVLSNPFWQSRLKETVRELGVHMLVGSALLQEGRDRNSALLLNPSGEWEGVYHKKKLVPFSEYQPWGTVANILKVPFGRRGYQFQAGRRPGVFFVERTSGREMYSQLFGVLICSEEGYPALAAELAVRKAGFLVAILNDGWFDHTQALMMHAQMGIFRAVENRFPLVRAANTGWSVAFDAFGRKIGERGLSPGQEGTLSVDIVPKTSRFRQAKSGDFFQALCAGFVIMTLLTGILRRRKEGAYAG